MPHRTFQVKPAKPIDGDPFGLHYPPTLGDLERIEQALVDGSVRGAEADRLRAIRDSELTKLAEAFKGITTSLNDHFEAVFPKLDFGPRLADLMPKMDLGPKLVDLVPKLDLGPRLADLMPKMDLRPQLGELLPKTDYAKPTVDIGCPPFGSVVSFLDITSTLEDPAIGPIDSGLFVDERRAHMEELAEPQLEALRAACESLEVTAQAMVESDKRAEERFAYTKRMNRSQTRTVVIVTILAALLSGGAGAILATLLQ